MHRRRAIEFYADNAHVRPPIMLNAGRKKSSATNGHEDGAKALRMLAIKLVKETGMAADDISIIKTWNI